MNNTTTTKHSSVEEYEKVFELAKPKECIRSIKNKLFDDLAENVNTSQVLPNGKKKETCLLFCSHSSDAKKMLGECVVGYFPVDKGKGGVAYNVLIDEKTAEEIGRNAFYQVIVWKGKILGLHLIPKNTVEK